MTGTPAALGRLASERLPRMKLTGMSKSGMQLCRGRLLAVEVLRWRRQRPSLGRTAWEWSRRPVISLRRPPTARSRRTGTRGPPRRDGRKSRRRNCKGSSPADRKRPPRTPRRARAKASPRIRPVFSYATVGPQGPGRVQMFRQAGITSAKSREFISASFACLRLTATTLARLSE